MTLSRCLHNLTKHMNRIHNVGPRNGEIKKTTNKTSVLRGIYNGAPESLDNLIFCSIGHKHGLAPSIPVSVRMSRAYLR